MASYNRGDTDVVDHVAATDIAVDDVVVLGGVSGKKATVGVARNNILTGETGRVAVKGVFNFPKVATAVITAGQSVNWDASNAAVEDNAASGSAGDVVEFGKAMENAGNGDTEVLVEIDIPGTFT